MQTLFQGSLQQQVLYADQSGEFETVEAAKDWLANERIMIMLSLQQLMTIQKRLVPELLASKREDVVLDAAGKFKEEEEEWLANGLNGFIFAGQNIIEKLNAVADKFEGGTIDE